MRLFDTTLTQLERGLDARLARHNALAQNLANADTPGFVPRTTSFHAALAGAEGGSGPALPEAREGDIPMAAAAGPASAPIAPPAPFAPSAPGEGASESPGLDGNRVDTERTLVALAENALQYGAGARAAGKKLAILRYVASDGAA